MSKTFTTAEVGKHKDDANGYWLIIENDVYDLTGMFFDLVSASLLCAGHEPSGANTHPADY